MTSNHHPPLSQSTINRHNTHITYYLTGTIQKTTGRYWEQCRPWRSSRIYWPSPWESCSPTPFLMVPKSTGRASFGLFAPSTHSWGWFHTTSRATPPLVKYTLGWLVTCQWQFNLHKSGGNTLLSCRRKQLSIRYTLPPLHYI